MPNRIWDQEKFNEWLQRVDTIVIGRTGMSRDDLPDWGYADSFQRSESPSIAATLAIRAAKEF